MQYDDLKPRLGGVTVQNLRGEMVDLESIWKERAVLLAFLRHFG